MDTRCHRTTTTTTLSPPSSNLAHSFNRGKKVDQYQLPVGLTQITCPPHSMRALPEAWYPSHSNRKKVASKESAQSSFPSPTPCTTMSITMPHEEGLFALESRPLVSKFVQRKRKYFVSREIGKRFLVRENDNWIIYYPVLFPAMVLFPRV